MDIYMCVCVDTYRHVDRNTHMHIDMDMHMDIAHTHIQSQASFPTLRLQTRCAPRRPSASTMSAS